MFYATKENIELSFIWHIKAIAKEMIIVSYDIKDDKLRTKFQKALTKNGAIRLQYSVYEINNTERVMKNLLVLIEDKFSKEFGGDDSVIIFDVSSVKLKKYGNAIHRDQDVVYF